MPPPPDKFASHQQLLQECSRLLHACHYEMEVRGAGRGRSGGAEECWGGVGGGGIEIEWREWWRAYEGEGRKDRRERRYWNDGGGREEGRIKRRRGMEEGQ